MINLDLYIFVDNARMILITTNDLIFVGHRINYIIIERVACFEFDPYLKGGGR